MAEPLYLASNNTMKANKTLKEYPKKAKGISFSAFLLSIFIYVSIFYIFDLSPYSLFNTTKFWFLISNTLILIIAADYGDFSSSKQSQDYFYEECMVHSTGTALPVQEVVSQKNKFIPGNYMYSLKQREDLYEEHVLHTTNCTVLPVQEVENSEENKLVCQKSEIIPKNNLEIVMIKSDTETPSRGIQETMPSETALEVVHVEDENEEKHKAICWSEETDQMPEESCIVEEDNEFSSMTDEELNLRVEEFIQNFNRQIRLQRAENFG